MPCESGESDSDCTATVAEFMQLWNPTEKLRALKLQSWQLPALVLYAPKVTAKSLLGKSGWTFPAKTPTIQVLLDNCGDR
jgi:hypothetical protein